jgi:hypothetical protein
MSLPQYVIIISPKLLEIFAEIIKGNPPFCYISKDFIFLRILSSFLNPIRSFLS